MADLFSLWSRSRLITTGVDRRVSARLSFNGVAAGICLSSMISWCLFSKILDTDARVFATDGPAWSVLLLRYEGPVTARTVKTPTKTRTEAGAWGLILGE